MRFYSVLKSRQGEKIDFEKIEKEIEKVCNEFNISLFYIYGSYSTGKTGKLSDIDVAYLSEEEFDRKIDLIEKLEEIFKDEAIDIVDLKKAPLTLIHRILKEGKCLYTKDLKTKIKFETEKENEYFDSYYIRNEYFEKMKEKIENGSFWD